MKLPILPFSILLGMWIWSLPGAGLDPQSLGAHAPSLPQTRVAVKLGNRSLRVWLAEREEERRSGLMGVSGLADDEGLVMVFHPPQPVALWMKDVPIALDAGFFDRDGRLRQVAKMQPDGGVRIFRYAGEAAWVLEVRAGWFEDHEARVGDRLEFMTELPRGPHADVIAPD